MSTASTAMPPPVGLLAELTHRCPLQCPYCSNPLELERKGRELPTEAWLDVFRQAADLGVLHLHLSGGEPTARRDLDALVDGAAQAGLYTNLITSGVLLAGDRLERLAAQGLDHVQISFQDAAAAPGDVTAGHAGAHALKIAAARRARAAGLALTVNAPVHRRNIDRLEAIIALAVELGAGRLEVAHVQYLGWALANRAALMPTRDQVRRSADVVERAQQRLKGVLSIDFVVPDYYAIRPKPCMGGWGRRSLNVTPSGMVLPCHAAETLPGLAFDNVRTRPLADIWQHSEAFRRFRGIAWMPEPCRSCDRREIDWGGCRCQAFAILGDAALTDPACGKSQHHARLTGIAERDAVARAPDFLYRRYRRSGSPSASRATQNTRSGSTRNA